MNALSWTDAQRLEGWAGEIRVNLIRLVALIAFCGNHLVNVFLWHDEAAAGRYHVAATALALLWGVEVTALYFCLSRRWVPPALKYVATATDLVLVTALLVLGGDSKSTLSALYFAVIAASALRLSLPLVYAATLGAMAGELFFFGYVKYWLQLPPDARLPRP